MNAALLLAALVLPTPDAKVEVLEVRHAPRCQAVRYEPARLLGSGRVAVRYRGQGCEGWAWARVRVTVERLAAAKALKAGDALDGATRAVATELRPGDDALAEVPAGARAAIDIPAGAPLTPDRVRVGPPPGASIEVLMQAGALAVESPATVVSCSRHQLAVCAALPSGKRVSGRIADGRLLVDLGGLP